MNRWSGRHLANFVTSAGKDFLRYHPHGVRPKLTIVGHPMPSNARPSLSFDARRVIDFLAEEHMRHGGMENGRLKAPHRQLVTCAISKRNVRRAVDGPKPPA
jgi:hypothetical protein